MDKNEKIERQQQLYKEVNELFRYFWHLKHYDTNVQPLNDIKFSLGDLNCILMVKNCIVK